MNQQREYYRRHLPHWQPVGATFFVTFRLKGSLPLEVIRTLKEEREWQKKNITTYPEDERIKKNYLDERLYFRKWDSLLDKAESGPRWFSQPEIAGIINEALHHRNGKEYDLFAFCIMSNHVHAVFEPLESSSGHKSDWQSDLQTPLSKIMQSLKRHTARKSNIVLVREGAFWQDESYNHVIRNNAEFERVVNYVLENPVKAGLVSKWKDWPWTFCKPFSRITNPTY